MPRSLIEVLNEVQGVVRMSRGVAAAIAVVGIALILATASQRAVPEESAAGVLPPASASAPASAQGQTFVPTTVVIEDRNTEPAPSF